MAYFVDSGNALSSWIYKGTNNLGQSIVSGAAYNFASGTLGYQVQNIYAGGGYPDWRRSFTGEFPRRGICTFAVRPAAPSGNDFIFGPGGSCYTAGSFVDWPFGIFFNWNGSIYARVSQFSSGVLGSSYASGAWIVWRIDYNFDTHKGDYYRNGSLVGSQLAIGNAGASYAILPENVFDFRMYGSNYSARNIDFDDIYISATISDCLCNANVKGPIQAHKVCTARVSQSLPGGDIVLVDGQAYTSNWEAIHIVKKINQPSEFECRLIGVEEEDKTHVKEENIVQFYSENMSNRMLKGRIKTVQYETEYDCTIKGFGMELDLADRRVHVRNIENKSVFTNKNSEDIVNTLCSINDDGAAPWLMEVNQNDNYGKIAIRFDEEDKLKALAAVAEQCGFDWWISHVGDDQDFFNIGLKSTTPKMTFYTGGDNQNCWKVNYEKDTEELANFVIALGYGDGVNQINELFYEASPTKTFVSGGVVPGYTYDSDTVFLYHFENNGTDAGSNALDLVQSGTVPFNSTIKKLGNYSAGSFVSGSYFNYTGSPNTMWLNNMPVGTIECWLYPTASGAGYFIENVDSDTYFETHAIFYARIYDSKVYVYWYYPDLPYYKGFTSNGSLALNEWNHVAIAWDVEQNFAKIFINGSLDRLVNGSYYIPDSVYPKMDCSIGRYGFKGFIDEMRLSDVVRTDFTVTEPPVISATQTEIGASGTSGFDVPGTINIGNEVIVYSGTDASTFKECTRGSEGTTAETHPHNALVYKYIPTGTFWTNHKLAESGSSIYANKIKTRKLEDKSIDSINQLQLMGSNYLLDHKTSVVKMTVEVGDVRDVYATVDVGDWVTVVDTDTGLNSDYKVVGMEIDISQENGETLYLELSSRKSVFLEQLMKTNRSVESQGTYGQGATNVFQIGPMAENAVGGTTGFDYPLQMKFYIPEDALAINKVKVNWKQSDFQGFTSGTNATIFTQSGAMQSVSIKIDGSDKTQVLGGPWSNSSVSDLDISNYVTATGYHTIELSPAGSIARRITADGWAQVYVQSK